MSSPIKYLAILLAITSLCMLLASCQSSNPVENIHIKKAPISNDPPSTGVFIRTSTGANPTSVHYYEQSDEIWILLELKTDLDSAVTFTKIAFFNKGTGTEDVAKPYEDLGPVEPGGSILWQVPLPDEDGEYELRIYWDNSVVASALISIS
ncbi:MAG: hypothetical protein PHY25_02465 [Dehalococcoidales bacterium]|nr:hypothetical protein [Dehalococcoidales bacterium]MDD4465532.1 hypothetical protein [Dehalococcoidales bacterium]MDD5402367.1 hypothetical protein [Dehalococcoidales bacterium]